MTQFYKITKPPLGKREPRSMSTTIYRLIRVMAGEETGRTCRRCAESIRPSDPFGMSEGVCRACRLG